MRFLPLGDRAVSIRLGDSIDEATHRRVRAVCARLDAREIPGVVEYVPAYASVVVYYQPERVPSPDAARDAARDGDTPYARIVAALEDALTDLGGEALPPPRTVEIPVCYGGDLGPDLGEVAARHALAPEEVVHIHATGDYLVYMVGFMPGFPYMGGLDARIATPRRAVPRTSVPASSVGIGGSQTGVYSMDSPGGWHIIGRTPLRIFTPEREPPILLHMGDRVRFRPIPRGEYERLLEAGARAGAHG